MYGLFYDVKENNLNYVFIAYNYGTGELSRWFGLYTDYIEFQDCYVRKEDKKAEEIIDNMSSFTLIHIGDTETIDGIHKLVKSNIELYI